MPHLPTSIGLPSIKILSVGKWDWAGCGYFLSQAINECTPHKSVASKDSRSKFGFPHEWLNPRPRQLLKLWEWADVVHIHDAIGNKRTKGFPDRPTVITYHGTLYRDAYKAQNELVGSNNRVGTVATPDLTRFGLRWMPDCRPDLREYFDPGNEFTVAHSPSNRNIKGTELVILACKYTGIKLDLIENVLWEECVRRKGRAHVVVDQFELGYGCNAIEAWAVGLPVISDGTDENIIAIKEEIGYLPFLRPNPDLSNVLVMMRDETAFYNNWAEIGRKHYEKYHAPEAAAERAVGYYMEALG